GSSEESPTVEARTKGRPPEAPPQFQFVTTNSSQATLYLSQWNTGGCPILFFNVQYSNKGQNQWTTVGSEVPPSRTYAVSGLAAGAPYDLKVTAHNAAGSKTQLYSIVTQSIGLGAGSGLAVWEVEEISTSAPVIWLDPGLLVPAAVSLTALALTIATIVLCLRKRSSSSSGQINRQQISLTAEQEKSELRSREQAYSTVRRLPIPEPPPQKDISHGEYSEEEIYPYATATFQLRGTPPPPAPPSPRGPRVQQKQNPQKSFTALVYQPPSLHDVDSPNIGDRKKHIHRGFPYEESETDDYGTSLHSIDPRAPNRRPKQPRSSRTVHINRIL
ncbi:unnamed protein product, partial [Meganyctiphanes norvegica]